MSSSVSRLFAVLGAAALLGACQSARTSDEDQKRAEQRQAEEKQALERRVEQLERQLATQEAAAAAAASYAPTPAPVVVAPAPRRAAATPAPRSRRYEPVRTDEARTAGPFSPAPDRPVRSERPRPTPPERPRAIEPESFPVREPEPRPEPRPEWVEPKPEPIVVPAGSQLDLKLENALSSETSREGDAVTARVEGGDVALPGGTFLKGRVVEARPSGRVKGRARLAVVFDRIVVRGEEHPVETIAVVKVAKDSRKRDAAMVGGGAAIGAFLGAVTGGSVGKGAVIGAGAGGGAVLATKGEEIKVPAGSRWTVQVSRPARF
jgi:hypothetical protein